VQTIPEVTVRQTWQGWIVQDPYMPQSMAVAICDNEDDAVEQAEDWARDMELPVRVIR
jgi:hypothetical protein